MTQTRTKDRWLPGTGNYPGHCLFGVVKSHSHNNRQGARRHCWEEAQSEPFDTEIATLGKWVTLGHWAAPTKQTYTYRPECLPLWVNNLIFFSIKAVITSFSAALVTCSTAQQKRGDLTRAETTVWSHTNSNPLNRSLALPQPLFAKEWLFPQTQASSELPESWDGDSIHYVGGKYYLHFPFLCNILNWKVAPNTTTGKKTIPFESDWKTESNPKNKTERAMNILDTTPNYFISKCG